jgi:RNA polymerase sigma-70 factor (ECF subfamily)
MEWLTTSTILSGLREYDNEPAWKRFDARFRRPVVRFAVASGLAHCDAEDVAQEVMVAFVESYRRGDYDRQKGRLSRWLFGLAYNHLLRFRQKQGRQKAKVISHAQSEAVLAALSVEETASRDWDRTWDEAIWRECLDRARIEFAPETMAAFELSVRGDRKPAVVADELGLSVKSVYNARHRILKRLRELREELEAVE